MELKFSLLSLLCVLFEHGSLSRPPISQFPRQAPFCVMDDTEPDLQNFVEIFEYHNSNPEKYVPVSPDRYHSPTGFIQNITLTRIFIKSTAYPDMPMDHPYRTFQNYFHITIIADELTDGLEGLYVQAISGPLGIPFGEFISDFDCGDCGPVHSTSTLEDEVAIVPCQYRPAASFLQPNIYSVGGKAQKPKKFHQAHFHFRYVDYPCFDVTYAQFLVIAVRKFSSPLQYEVFYSPMYKVQIEGVGAPFPMYYGLTPSEISCHHADHLDLNNWFAQRNQKAKVKYNEEFDNCTYTEKIGQIDLLGDDFCPPGPVTCGSLLKEDYPPTDGSEWAAFRKEYLQVEPFCMDCGEWEDRIGPYTWPKPKVVTDSDAVDSIEIYVTRKPIVFVDNGSINCGSSNTEERDAYGKNSNGSRDQSKSGCPPSFTQDIATKGYVWGQTYLLTLHNFLLLFTWTVGSNCLIFCARFMKEASFAEKGSGCFGIGKWMWEHIFWMYICFTTMAAGVFLMLFLDQEALCAFYDSAVDTEGCLEDATGHKILGSLACLAFLMGFLSGWTRPDGRLMRDLVIYYHAGSGYIAKYLGLFCIFSSRILLSQSSIISFILLEVTFIIFFIVATVVQKMMDNRMLFRVRDRRIFPVPEGIDTFSDPPLKNVRALLFPFLIVTQLALFAFGSFNVFEAFESRI